MVCEEFGFVRRVTHVRPSFSGRVGPRSVNQAIGSVDGCPFHDWCCIVHGGIFSKWTVQERFFISSLSIAASEEAAECARQRIRSNQTEFVERGVERAQMLVKFCE